MALRAAGKRILWRRAPAPNRLRERDSIAFRRMEDVDAAFAGWRGAVDRGGRGGGGRSRHRSLARDARRDAYYCTG